MLVYVELCYAGLGHVMSCYVTLRYLRLGHGVLCYVMLCYDTLCEISLR